MTIVAIVFAVGLLYFGASALLGTGELGGGGTAPSSPIDENLPNPGIVTGVSMSIQTDPSTWPGGDNIWNICRAIAFAEGANIPGSVPDRLNNPGDISDGANVFGAEHHSGSNVTFFPDKETGWSWLYEKISNAVYGRSHVYLPSMTWTQFAQKYAGNWEAWVNNVTTYLGVDPNSTLSQYTGFGG
jgi:hypothetical protein